MKKLKRLPFDKKPKKKPIGSLKKKAWKVFSIWIRKRGSTTTWNRCVTCQKSLPIKSLHAGHYLHGHSKATFMMEENVHCQCIKCNHFLSGNLLEYHSFMLKTYGESVIEQLKQKSKEIWKPSREQLEEIIAKYS